MGAQGTIFVVTAVLHMLAALNNFTGMDDMRVKVILRKSLFQRLRMHVGETMMKWTENLSEIGAVLYDAEEKQLTSKAVELWLDDLRDLAYEVEDLLEKLSTEILRRKVYAKNGAGKCKVRGLFPKLKFQYKMNREIEGITGQLNEISARKDKLGLSYIELVKPLKACKISLPPSSRRPDGPVIGRSEDKRQIMELLSKGEPACTVNFQVVAIVGMPGIGKTTIAGHVFNDGSMVQFYPRVWVSVSDDFNIVRLTKAILESTTSQHCAVEEFDKVQDNLSKKLQGKKFLIVFDDVWRTCDYGLWTKLQSPFHVGAPGSRIIVTTRDSKVAKIMGATQVHNLEPLSNDDCLKVFEQHAFLSTNIVGRGIPPPNLESLQRRIVAKCSGLPLVARLLGG